MCVAEVATELRLRPECPEVHSKALAMLFGQRIAIIPLRDMSASCDDIAETQAPVGVRERA